MGEKGLSQASPPASGGLPAIFGPPWLVEASPDLCLCVHTGLSLCECPVSKFPLFVRTAVVLG